MMMQVLMEISSSAPDEAKNIIVKKKLLHSKGEDLNIIGFVTFSCF